MERVNIIARMHHVERVDRMMAVNQQGRVGQIQ